MCTFSKKYIIATQHNKRASSPPIRTTAKPIRPLAASTFTASYLTDMSPAHRYSTLSPFNLQCNFLPKIATAHSDFPATPFFVKSITSSLAKISLQNYPEHSSLSLAITNSPAQHVQVSSDVREQSESNLACTQQLDVREHHECGSSVSLHR